MITRSRLTFTASLLLVALAAGCGGGPAENEQLGQLRIRPGFAPGEEPGDYGVDVGTIRVIVRRGSATGPVAIDTTLAFEAGAALSWILELAAPPERLDIAADLAGGGRLLYQGSLEKSVSAGVGSTIPVTDLLVRYVGPAVASIDVAPGAATVTAPGATQQFQAVARGAGGAPETGFAFAWTSSNPAVATVDPFSGLATAVGVGSVDISASAGGVVGTARLTVSPITTIVVSPTGATLAAFSARQQFVAEALDALGNPIPNVTFDWSSDAPGVLAIDPVSGVATANANGTAGVTASAAGISGSAPVTVRQVAASIAVSPTPAGFVSLGVTLPFAAEARDANGFVIADAVFSWTTLNSGVATVGASTGVATSVGVGSTSVVATTAGVSGSAPLVVTQVIASIVVTPATASLSGIGATQQYAAVAFDANGRVVVGAPITWSSSAPSVAVVDPTSGLATAAAVGSTTIGATAGGVSATATLMVSQVGRSLTVLPPQATLTDIGQTQQFSAVVTDGNGAAVPGVVITWTIGGGGGVATIDAATGLATAIGFGATTVVANGAGLTGSALLTVAQPIVSVDVVPASAAITAGSSFTFTAVARDARGRVVPGATFLWGTSAPGVATVQLVGGVATGVGPGTTTISASAGVATGRATLSVSAGGTGPVASIAVSPDPGFIDALGGTRTFQAVARDANGNVLPGIVFAWSSSQPGVADVDQTGLATGVATGTATLTATAGGVIGNAVVQVRQVVASVSVQPAASRLGVGDSIPLIAVARDARGNLIPGVSFAWSSSDPTVATVSGNGLVHAVAAGLATIQAVANGIVGSATVDAVTVGSIVISPNGEPETRIGQTIQFTAQVFDPAGNPLPGVRVTWTSAQPSVASIDASSGLATGLATGSAFIVAKAGTVNRQVRLAVRP